MHRNKQRQQNNEKQQNSERHQGGRFIMASFSIPLTGLEADSTALNTIEIGRAHV